MENNIAYTLNSNKPFDEVVEALEKNSIESMFRVLYTHDVQETLAGKTRPSAGAQLL